MSELIEFIGMLLIEKKCKEESNFLEYFHKHSNSENFNKRYMELLDNFLNLYANDKIGKPK